MKKLLLASAALFALGASASAADLPARAPAMAPAPVFVGMNWSGFYVGLQAGYLWSDNTITIPQPGGPAFNFTATPGPDAFSIGGQIGYRHQYANGFVVGVEADVSALLDSRNGGPYFGALGAFPSASEHKWDASLRLQLGYSMGRWLPYLTGGVSFLNEDGCQAPTAGAACILGTAYNSTRTGWTIGAGVAFAVTNNLIVNAEYRFADYGSKTYSTPGWALFRTESDLQTSKVLVGLSWKFGSASPVMARY